MFCIANFCRFGHYPCFATDVEKYLHELNEEEKAELLDKISKKFAVYSEAHMLGCTVTVFRIQEICSSMWKKSIQGTFYLLIFSYGTLLNIKLNSIIVIYFNFRS